MNIFIARHGQTTGPFDTDTINARLITGELSPDDLAWSEGAANWQPLSALDGIVVPAPGQVPLPPPIPSTGTAPTGMPPLPTTSAPPARSALPSPHQAASDTEHPDVETLIFDTSASPIALSMKDIVLGLLCTGGLWCIYVVARNLTTRYKLTNQRLTLRSGLISQKVEEVEVYRVRDVSMEQEVVGRLLGFGDVVVHSSDPSSPKIVLKNVHSPNKIKEQIRVASRQGRRFEGVRTGEYMG